MIFVGAQTFGGGNVGLLHIGLPVAMQTFVAAKKCVMRFHFNVDDCAYNGGRLFAVNVVRQMI